MTDNHSQNLRKKRYKIETDEQDNITIKTDNEVIHVDTSLLDSQLAARQATLKRDLDNEHLSVYDNMDTVNTAVLKEIDRQFVKFGVQEHASQMWFLIATEEIGEIAKALIEHHFRNGSVKDIYKETVETIACLMQFLAALDRE